MKTRRQALASLAALSIGAAVFACGSADAQARRPAVQNAMHHSGHGQLVSVSLESEQGRALDSYWYEGALYVAGNYGQRYHIRLTNNTPERVEAVVTVDGRDVVSGSLGDYKKQRGYVLDPYGSVTIEGFRRSLDHVAAFRFSDLQNSYSARRGTPQHVGVIGVAVFREQMRRPPRNPRPVYRDDYRNNRRHYQPYDDGDVHGYEQEARPDSFPRSSRKRKSSGRSAGAAPSADASAAESAPAEDYAGGSARGRRHYYEPRGGAERREFAPAPRPQNELGTEFGETRYSSVREVDFQRRNRRRPDAMLSVYYDSLRGLRARGVPVDPPRYPYDDGYWEEPDPWPYARGFTPPPPPRRY